MKSSLLILTLATTLVLSAGYATPRGKATSTPEPRPAPMQKVEAAKGCTKMVVRSPGRRAPRMVNCSPQVCARAPRCAGNCAR